MRRGPSIGGNSDTEVREIGRWLSGEKSISIYINARKVSVPTDSLERGEEISFEQIVELAITNGLPSGDLFEYRIKYTDAVGRPPDGDLSPGHSVKIHDGTIFTVTATDLS